jgi:hypothetical protein
LHELDYARAIAKAQNALQFVKQQGQQHQPQPQDQQQLVLSQLGSQPRQPMLPVQLVTLR